MRSFIAIELDPTIKDAILAFIQKLDASAPNIRWVQPQGMHLTLKFLGEVAENKITEIRSVLDKIVLKMTPQERIGNMLELFNKHSVRYYIVGPFALAFYARPRYTKDFDIDLHQFLLAFKTAPPLKLHFPM